MVNLIEIVIIPIVIFIIGFFILKKIIEGKSWENSKKSSLIINSIWLVINIPLIFIILNSLGDSSFFKIFLITVNILVGILILWSFYRKALLKLSILISIVQVALFAIWLLLSTIPEIINIFLTEGGDELDASKISFTFAFLFLFGLSVFIANWGDKIQLVKYRKLITIGSIFPGIYYLIINFVNQGENFNVADVVLISFLLEFITIFIIKRIAYTTIQFQEIRGLTVLKKGKSLLEVKDLKVYYPLLKGILKRQVGAVKAVDGVSFHLKTGETLGLVGESGCGKTTIAKAILGLVEKTDGEMSFRDESIPPEYSTWLRQKIQMVFQDPDASLNPRLKVVDIIAEPLKNLHGITNKIEIRKQVLRLLDQVSLKREHMDRFPHEFSGGQKQRIVIARTLACNPELIVLDEPTSALDVSVQAQILNLLKDLQAKYGYGFLFITHNLAVVNHIADRVAVMYLGKIVEIGNIDQIFSNPTHPYTQALLSSRSEIDPFNQEISFVIRGEVPSPIAPPSGCYFNPRCCSDARTKECEIQLPHKIKIEEDHYIWCVNPPKSMQSTIQKSKEYLLNE
ncbi:MAG: oligopeptide/dipeptide ABC transporter ATP-binding protein [Promethearchaeota archaeon]